MLKRLLNYMGSAQHHNFLLYRNQSPNKEASPNHPQSTLRSKLPQSTLHHKPRINIYQCSLSLSLVLSSLTWPSMTCPPLPASVWAWPAALCPPGAAVRPCWHTPPLQGASRSPAKVAEEVRAGLGLSILLSSQVKGGARTIRVVSSASNTDKQKMTVMAMTAGEKEKKTICIIEI